MDSSTYLAVAEICLYFCHVEVQCDVHRAALSSGGTLFCVWLSGSHLFLHQQETLHSTQTSTAESSIEDGLESSLRDVRPKDIVLEAMLQLGYLLEISQKMFGLFIHWTSAVLFGFFLFRRSVKQTMIRGCAPP